MPRSTWSRGRFARLVAAATIAVAAVSSISKADDFSTSGLPIDGPPNLAAADQPGFSSDAVAEIDPSTGAARTSLSFSMPAARGAGQPALQLIYSSAVGMGVAGPGWSLSLPSVERRGAAGFPKFVNDAAGSAVSSRCANDVPLAQIGTLSCADRFLIAGKPQVPICIVDDKAHCNGALPNEVFPEVLSGWTYFRSEVDDGNRAFWSPTGETWIVQTKAGITSVFGRPLDTVLDPVGTGNGIERSAAFFREKPSSSPPDPTGLPNATDISGSYRWNLVRQYDTTGNGAVYQWDGLAADPDAPVEGIQFLTDIYDTPTGHFGPPPLGLGGAPVKELADFAHHAHLLWRTETTGFGAASQSPNWRAVPPFRLIRVDITSKNMSGTGPRELLRRYHLEYTWNTAHTRAFLTSFQLEGRCVSPIAEDVHGFLPDNTQCDRLPAATFGYTEAPIAHQLEHFTPAENLPRGIGAIAIKDVNGDAIPELLYRDTTNRGIIDIDSRSVLLTSRTFMGPQGTGTATLDEIAPGAAHATFGDFLHNGQLNAILVKPPSSANQTGSFQIFSLDVSSVPASAWFSRGPFQAPSFFPATNWTPSSDVFEGAGRLLTIDLDGDGLTDLLLKIDSGPTGAGVPPPEQWQPYFSATGADGFVQPFAERGKITCVPHHVPAVIGAGTRAPQVRLMADFDGDGLVDFIELEQSDSVPFVNHVFKGRGDGRFGLGHAASLDPCDQAAGQETSFDWIISNTSDVPKFSIGPQTGVAMHDVDGDGLADLVVATADGISLFRHIRQLNGSDAINTTADDHVSAEDLQVNGCVTRVGPENPPFDPSRTALLFADVDARGVDDLVVVTGFGGNCVIRFAPGLRPGLLNHISNGLGAETSIEYSAVVDMWREAQDPQNKRRPWKRPLPVPAQVVKSIVTTNGIDGPFSQSRQTQYAYADPVWDVRDRLFLGFEQVTSKEPGEPASDGDQSPSPGKQTRTTFLTRTCPEADSHQPCSPSKDYPFLATRGVPGVVEIFDEGGSTHLITLVHTYTANPAYHGLDGRQVRPVEKIETDSIIWEPTNQVTTPAGGELMFGAGSPELSVPELSVTVTVDVPSTSPPAKRLRRSFEYDAFSNPTTVVNFGDLSADNTPVASPIVNKFDWAIADPPCLDCNHFVPVPTGWTWRPISHAVGYGDKQGNMTNPAREVHYSWNRAGLLETVTANLSGTIPLFRRNGGSAVAPTPPDASVDGPVTLATMSYDTFGNLSRTITPNGRCSDIAYDLAYQQLPVVHRAGCETANALVTASEFDRGLGAVVKETSPDTTVRGAQYDGFGRLIEIDQPDALTPGKISPFPSTTIDWTLADKGPISKVHSRSISGSGPAPEYAESWTYLDSLGNLLATVSKDGITDQWIVTGLAARAVNGRILRLFEAQSLPGKDGSAFQLTAPPLAASITYDALGRRLSATGVDGFTTTFKQLPTEFSVEVQDPEQQPGGGHSGSFTTLKSDVFGRHVATIRHFANDPQQVITTTMEYEASGELLRVFRAVEGGGPPIRQEHFYDSFGRRVRTIELNTLDGDAPQSWAYAYNDNGDLMGTSDAMGCGENFFYDNLGRLLAEDYSPCSPEQTPYSPPNFSTGEGIEKLNVYDGPATPTGTPSDAVYRGHLTQTFDLAQKSDIVLDARGRAVLLRRQMSLPGARSNAFALRYAPRVYEQQVLAFDEANRPLTRTTGAETPELRPPNVGSWIAANYDLRGAVHSVTSSYGDLITEQEFNSAGSLTRRVMGDAAGTVLSAGYDDARIIKSFKIARRPGPWLPAGPTYVPPDPGSANTVQGVLTDLSFNKYDRVRNALEIAEAAPAADWPPGARPALQTSAQYDDAYRLRQVNRRYSSPEAAASDDVAISPLANEVGKGAFPVVETAANRIRKETFDYDWMGNVTAADDDAHLFDRSTGAVSLTPNHPHRVASLKQGNVSATVSYDTAGHVTRVELTRDKPCTARCPVLYSYHWDELGRLAGGSRTDAIPGIDKPQVEAEISYVYGGDGQRVLKALGPAKFLGELRFSINIFDTLSLERTSFDPAAGDYVRDARSERVHLSSPTGMLGLASLQAPDVPSGSAGRTRVFLALPDLLGSPAFMIDRETSELVEHATFEAAGIAEADFRPDRWGNFRYQYRHTGHSDDIEIGLVNFGARYYAPMLGRWLSPDPLTVHAMAGDMNPYRFVRGSPLRLVDPVGLDDCDVLTPGCGGFSETFPGDPDAGSGPVAGIGPGSGPSGASHGSGGASPPRPPVPGPVKAFDSPAGMLALVTGQPNVQVDLPGGYFVNTDRFGIAVINTLSSTLAHLPSTIPSNNPLLEKVLPVLEKQAEDMLRIQNETTETKDVSVLAGAITALSAMALVPVGGEEAELANLPIAWEEIAPTWHHIFPQAKEFAKFWERAGIDIHEYLALLPRDIHLEQLHGPGNPPIPGAGARGGIWNANWREFFAPFEKTGTYPTREEIFNQARIMLKGFDVYSFHPSTFRVPLPPRPTR